MQNIAIYYMTARKAILVLVLLILVPVLAQEGNESTADVENESTPGAENETTSSTVEAGNETTEYFENQEEMEEKAADILQIIMSIVRDILRYMQTTLSEMPVTE